VLAIGVFVWAAGLGAGDMAGFAAVCALSGVALGADLAVPSALLAKVIAQDAAERPASNNAATEGIYFGWWNFAAKFNLALAAGLALPLLAWFGYTPGARSPQALQALTAAYCLLPCVLKAAATLALWRWLVPADHTLQNTPLLNKASP
jgi:glycoside/pentoside/hexuronide:cation symporter, GPH family